MSDREIAPFDKHSNEIACVLNAASYEGPLTIGTGGDATAITAVLPTLDSQTLRNLQVVVGNQGRIRERLSRSLTYQGLTIVVHVVRICTTESQHAEIESLATEVELILMERRPAIAGFTCVRSEIEQALDIEQLIDSQVHWEKISLVYR